ncbi:Phospholipase/carboxylesterase [Coprinellus micaceus]|uniref:Acyl-protein thioesterase 1 n=1 Tax=Coprinellus micaceus TaxID=71717 RepID=A0A4Y7SB89_COPMI|nr:Phospholipase/carboxylesterase [Coprinellus micaceus]
MPHRATVIFAHGMGQSNATWQMAFAKALAPQFPSVQWLLPQAPLRRVSINQGMLRPSWFDIWRLPPHPSEYDEQAITESISDIEDLILNQIHSGIEAKRIFLMGFSQGAALSLCVGLTTLNELGGIISMSGWLPPAYRSHITLGPSFPILWCHGTDDREIPISYGRDAVEFIKALPGSDGSRGNAVVIRTYSGLKHAINDAELADIAAFLGAQLQS